MRIGGKDINFSLGDLFLNADKVSLTIEDASEVAKNRGIPNGLVRGEVGASGDIELDAQNLAILSESARAAGSFRQLPAFDLLFYGKTSSGEELKVEAFGCCLKIDSLMDVDPKGGEKHLTKLSYVVTSPDFVHINGVPYLAAEETEGLISNESSNFGF